MSGEEAARSPDLALLRKAVDGLGEHFDTVQVFVTRHEAGTADGTKHISMGSGNWFARFGQIKVWVIQTDEHERGAARREMNNL